MDKYVLYTQAFMLITLIISLISSFVLVIEVLMQKIRIKWIMHLLFLEDKNKLDQITKLIKSKKDVDTTELQKLAAFYQQKMIIYGEEDKVLLSGRKKYLLAGTIGLLDFLSELTIVKVCTTIKEGILSIYSRVPFAVKNIGFFIWIYIDAAALWSGYYLVLYKVLDVTLTTYLNYLPFALILYTIVSSLSTRIMIRNFQSHHATVLADFLLRKAQVVFEIGLPLLTISLLISTIASFSGHDIQYSILQFLVLIYAPLIPIILSIKYELVEKPKVFK